MPQILPQKAINVCSPSSNPDEDGHEGDGICPPSEWVGGLLFKKTEGDKQGYPKWSILHKLVGHWFFIFPNGSILVWNGVEAIKNEYSTMTSGP